MLSPYTVLQLLSNATLVAFLALAIHDMLRPGKMLGWFARIVEWGYEALDVWPSCKPPTWFHKLPHRVYAFLTHSIRECFACLSGQIGVFYWWAFQKWPHSITDRLAMVTFLAACIILTYPLNKLKR